MATAPGTTTLSCTATDNAGNSSSYSTTVTIDGTAPSASFQYSGSYCPGGWYNTPVSPSVLASDPSGIGSVSFWVDGKPWTAGALIKDGIHALTAVVSDVAGNTTHISDTLQVDTYPPISSWITKSDTWVGGKTTLEGQSEDWTSGIAKVEISFDDGKTWVAIGNSPTGRIAGTPKIPRFRTGRIRFWPARSIGPATRNTPRGWLSMSTTRRPIFRSRIRSTSWDGPPP